MALVLIACAGLGPAPHTFGAEFRGQGQGAIVVLRINQQPPYRIDQTIDVTISLVNRDPIPHAIRYLQFDFQASDSEIVAGARRFRFLYPGVATPGYIEFLSLPVPAAVFTGVEEDFESMIVLPAGESIPAATISIRLPTVVGLYVLDVMNPDDFNSDAGAQLRFGFGTAEDPIVHWRSFDGELVGGVIGIRVEGVDSNCQLYGDVFPIDPPAGDCEINLDDLLCVLSAFSGDNSCPGADIFPCGGDDQIDLDDMLCLLAGFVDFDECRRGDITPCGGNGLIDLDDLTCLLDGFGDRSTCPQADVTPPLGNGVVDLDDLIAILNAFAGSFICAHPCPPPSG